MTTNVLEHFFDSFIVGIVTGIGAHLLIFRLGEWDRNALSIFLSYLLFGALAFTFEWSEVYALQFSSSCRWALRTIFWHILALYLSIGFYRLFLHRLNHFPGPLAARLSNFYLTFLSTRKGQLFREAQKLHQEFGDYVRLGPTELSITDPKAIAMIYGPQAITSKGPWYEVLRPRVSMVNERNKSIHARRRRVWDQGLNTKSLRGYEGRVLSYVDQLTKAVEQGIETDMDMAKWFQYFAIDVMGDLSFGMSLGSMLNNGDTYFLNSLHGTLKNIGFLSRMIWLIPIFMSIPGLNQQNIRFWDWIGMKVKHRIDNEPDTPDLFSFLLADYFNGPKTKQDSLNLHGDAFIIVVAGSGTTAAVLTMLFFHLAIDSVLMRRLQCDIDSLEDLSHDNLVQLDLLDAVINETMRLYPVVPSGTQRQTPPEGLDIEEVYVPGDVIVQVPLYTVFRDERNFERPEEFLPNRWTTQPHLIKNKTVFIPFLSGPYTCAGRRLALMELRLATAKLLKGYDVRLSSKQSKEKFLEGLRDKVTLGTAPLLLVWRRRL